MPVVLACDTNETAFCGRATHARNTPALSLPAKGDPPMPTLRLARPEDLPTLLAMQEASLRILAAGHYAPAVLEAAIARIGTMDTRLVTDRTYLVAESCGRIAGGAGWSQHAPNYARLMREVPPPLPGRTGLVRSVFVAPDFARRGLGRHLMQAVETRLAALGIATAELMATLSGVPLYAALGYRQVSAHAMLLGPGLDFEVRRMARRLEQRVAVAA
jgi:GNAT superfamily N-acetyltransferase